MIVERKVDGVLKSGIYQIRNMINSKSYVGSAVNIRDRWRNHKAELNRGAHGNSHLQNAWNKYGFEAFAFEILERIEPERLIEREQAWMDKLEVVKTGYNILPHAGSPLGMKLSAETKAKIGAASKGKTLSLEHRAANAVAAKKQWAENRNAMCASMKGKSSGMLGRKHLPETRAKIGVAHKGKKLSSEHRAKLSAATKAQWTTEARTQRSEQMRGRKLSPETRAKISAANAGRKRSLETKAKMSAAQKGKKHTPEAKAKMSAVRKGRKHSPETKAKIGAASKARWAKKRGENGMRP